MRRLFLLTMLLTISVLGACTSFAKSVIINDVKDLKALSEKVALDKPIVGSTLIIFDIDDTLLEAVSFVGSGKWYTWQRGRPTFDKNGNPVSINDKDKFNCIFGTLGTLFELGTTQLTQDDAADIFNSFDEYDRMILTARTYGFRSATERELKKHNLNLESEHLMAKGTGLEFALNPKLASRKITYKNGIVMSTGNNKGQVLIEILNRVNKSYEHIYFIDDSRKNIDNMEKAWKDSKTKVTLFHYTKVDKTVSQEEVAQSIASKIAFDNFLAATYPDTATAFTNGQCN